MSTPPPLLTRVTALLAQATGQPEGDISHGLELLLGLTGDGRIDPETYLTDPRPWTVRRLRPDRPDWHGELVRDDGAWTLRGIPMEDGPLWFLEVRHLHPGDYVTLRRPDGESLVFRVVGVTRA
jgi:hypothetical protein